MNSTDASRILGVPDSKNFKYQPARDVTIKSFHLERQYNLSDFDILPQSQKTDRVIAPSMLAEFQKCQTNIKKYADAHGPLGMILGQSLKKAVIGIRHQTCIELVRDLYNFGASRSEAISIVAIYVKKIPQPSDHRYKFSDAVRVVKWVWKEHGIPIWRSEGEQAHKKGCTCKECLEIDGLFGGDCLGYGPRSMRLPVIDQNGDLSVNFLLDIGVHSRE